MGVPLTFYVIFHAKILAVTRQPKRQLSECDVPILTLVTVLHPLLHSQALEMVLLHSHTLGKKSARYHLKA